jgi:hypothetical protein
MPGPALVLTQGGLHWPLVSREMLCSPLLRGCLTIMRCCSRLGKAKVVFGPYNSEQIGAILRDRLKSLAPVFHQNAITLAARKISSVSGDVRRALEVLRQAAEFWEQEVAQWQEEGTAGGEQPAALVGPKFVTMACQAMFSAAHMQVRSDWFSCQDSHLGKVC